VPTFVAVVGSASGSDGWRPLCVVSMFGCLLVFVLAGPASYLSGAVLGWSWVQVEGVGGSYFSGRPLFEYRCTDYSV